MALRGRGTRTCAVAAAWTVLAGLSATGDVAHAGKRKDTLKGWAEKVLPQVDGASAPNVVCEALEKRMRKQTLTVKKLQSRIDRGATEPPKTVIGIFKKLAGQPSENQDVAEARKRIISERAATEELEHLLRASNCKTTKFDAQIRNGPAVQEDIKLQPTDSLDDLTRLPQ